MLTARIFWNTRNFVGGIEYRPVLTLMIVRKLNKYKWKKQVTESYFYNVEENMVSSVI